MRVEFHRPQRFWELEPIRRQQTSFLRAFSNYPDIIEVGTDIWHDVYDWCIRCDQPMTISRDEQGRRTIMEMTTALVMRTDLGVAYIGSPYDRQ